MKYRLEIKEEAKDEISEAFEWYEARKIGLGSDFVNSLEDYFSKILEAPFLFPKSRKEDRVIVMNRFPFKIVFGIEDMSIIVYAVFHTSRNPKDLDK